MPHSHEEEQRTVRSTAKLRLHAPFSTLEQHTTPRRNNNSQVDIRSSSPRYNIKLIPSYHVLANPSTIAWTQTKHTSHVQDSPASLAILPFVVVSNGFVFRQTSSTAALSTSWLCSSTFDPLKYGCSLSSPATGCRMYTWHRSKHENQTEQRLV